MCPIFNTFIHLLKTEQEYLSKLLGGMISLFLFIIIYRIYYCYGKKTSICQ